MRKTTPELLPLHDSNVKDQQRRFLAFAAFGMLVLFAAIGPSAFTGIDPSRVGEAILHGKVPYRDFALEYPPGAALVLAVPALFTNGTGYMVVLRLLMLVSWAVLAIWVGRRAPKSLDGYLIASIAWSFIVVAIFDTLLALIAFGAFCAARRRDPVRAAAWIGGGVLLKWTPFVLGPPAAARSTTKGRTAISAVVAATLFVAIAVPVLIARPGDDPVSFQGKRPLHSESTLGSVIVLGRAILHRAPGVYFDHRSRSLVGLGRWATMLPLIAVAIAALALWRWGDPDEPGTWAALLLAVPALGPVASPQFFVWPLAFIGFLSKRVQWLYAGAGLLSLLFFSMVSSRPSGSPLPATTILIRNLLAIGAMAAAGWEGRKRAIA